MNLFDYSYKEQSIAFELNDHYVMVNATQMAKIYKKQVVAFLRNDNTKLFIQECLKSENSHFLSVSQEEDLVVSKQKSGTWMHRILALKFAAWLNPTFELWVYHTIDHILFGYFKRMEESLKQSAIRRNKIKDLETKFLENPDYLEFKKLQLEERQASYRRGKSNGQQLNAFQEMYINQKV